MNEPSERVFDLISGRLCLDLTNTVDWPRSAGDETLGSYADLLSWASQAGVVDAPRARALARAAKRDGAAAAAVLERAHRLREAVHDACAALAAGRRPRASDVEALNEELGIAMSHRRVELGGDGFRWSWREGSAQLDGVLWPVAQCAAELLTSPDSLRVHECAASRCAYLFVDSSPTGRRRWCDMKVCGNREKVRRHRERRRGAG